MILYASDLDRTLIYSAKFIEEYPTNKKYSPVEYKGIRVISYMDNEVKKRLHKIKDNRKITFVPVTTRSVEEYKRVKLGFTPQYAILSNGGTILREGEPLKEWEDYIKSKIDFTEAMDIIHDIEDELESVDYKVKMIDNCYLFFKTELPDIFDQEVNYLIDKYKNWTFTRQGKKCYVIPNHFSKQIALRWLWNRINKPYIVASGDSELDLPMLTLANRAIIPEHGSLVKDGFVLEGTFAPAGIRSPLFTFDIVEEEVNKQNSTYC